MWQGAFDLNYPGFPCGVVLLEGATITETPNRDMVQVDYTFQIGKFNPSFNCEMADGSSLYVPVGSPWDFVWFNYTGTPAGTLPKTIKRGILDVHVDRIYDMAIWTPLQLAGPFAPRMWPIWTPTP
jgi:hypothetical protein